MEHELQVISEHRYLLGIDLGGTGSRAALTPFAHTLPDASALTEASTVRRLDGGRISVTAGGSTVIDVAEALIGDARRAWPDARIAAVGVGAAGVASLVDDPDAAATRLARAADAPAALAADAVTANLGALAGAPGAVVAVGTGAIALGTDLDRVWRRVGGWGHLYDDRGSGAWIGIRALQAAIETHDGIRQDAVALLALATERFGPVGAWPAHLYPRADRAGVLAGLAADVARLADSGDAVATAILDEAGARIAATLAAALDPGLPRVASFTGGVFASPVVDAAFRREFARLAPDADLRAAAGTPLDGALHLARRLATGALPRDRPPYLWLAD
ncbi:hypothetical protein ET445_06325 [Agromyces protaetiae]|uniref:ATPase BadF/BadG/BcrA/BcrD type domain-containing protein n=1 Tax=Agromyces protaetiae TaxID=2509455 RepID=A0A4P6FBA4_9MICO|nr:BadF/BadG/BcrA/BcrD ATPase family protein [Agromyces protaetiae]QAY73015.1 hypothetical protein ET445_06325 [Agromyces protaetiae]